MTTYQIVQWLIFLSIPAMVFLNLWVKIRHYKQMLEIKERHIKVLEQGNTQILKHNQEMRQLLDESKKLIRSLRPNVFPPESNDE